MQDLHITQSTELFTGPTCKNTHWCKIKVALINTYYTYQHQLLSLKKNMLKTEWMFELFWRRRVTACNKITDAGVCKEHSGSTRILFQEATETQKADFTDQVKILTGRHLCVCVISNSRKLLLTRVWSCVCAGAWVPRRCHKPSVEESRAPGSWILQSGSFGGNPSHPPGRQRREIKHLSVTASDHWRAVIPFHCAYCTQDSAVSSSTESSSFFGWLAALNYWLAITDFPSYLTIFCPHRFCSS